MPALSPSSRKLDVLIEYDRVRVSTQRDHYGSSGDRELSLNSKDIQRDFSFTDGGSFILGSSYGQTFVQQLCTLLDQFPKAS